MGFPVALVLQEFQKLLGAQLLLELGIVRPGKATKAFDMQP